MEYQSKSYRLDEEVVNWLESLKLLHGSVNKALRDVMERVGARGAVGTITVNSEKKTATVNLLTEDFDPRSIEGVSTGFPPKKVSAGYSCECKHNAVHHTGRRFLSERRGDTLCPDCIESGHDGEPRDCRECPNGEGTGAL